MEPHPDRQNPSTARDPFGRALRLFFLFGTPIAVVLTAAMLYVVWSFNRPPVNMSKLKSLRPGVTPDHVIAAIGKPKGVYYEGRQWAYSRSVGWSIVYVYFDESNRFERFVYDY